METNNSVYFEPILDPEDPTPFFELVQLKRQERELADRLKLAQEKAIAYAMQTGQSGAKIDGAKVLLKFVSIKPKSSMISALEDDIEYFRGELKERNGDRIAALEAEIKSLTTNEEIQELEEKLQAEIAKLQGEKKPQISVTLPK